MKEYLLRNGTVRSCGLSDEDDQRSIYGYSRMRGIIAHGDMHRYNPSGFRGVKKVPRKEGYAFEAYIFVKKKNIHLGTFQDIDSAIAARKAAEQKYFFGNDIPSDPAPEPLWQYDPDGKMVTVAEYALKNGVTPCTINQRILAGKMPGVIKKKGKWYVPEDLPFIKYHCSNVKAKKASIKHTVTDFNFMHLVETFNECKMLYDFILEASGSVPLEDVEAVVGKLRQLEESAESIKAAMQALKSNIDMKIKEDKT